MRVLQVTPTYSPSRGGIEDVVENLSRALTGLGVRSDVVHVAPGLPESHRDDAGLTVMTTPLIGSSLVGIAPRLARIAASYDLIHVHDPRMAAISVTLALSRGLPPRLLSTHGGFFHTPRLKWLKTIHRHVSAPLLLGGYQAVLATSKSDLAFLSKSPGRTVVMENGVDISRFKRSARQGPRAMERWICWGRLSSNKRLDRLVDLVGQARSVGRIIDLLICGDDFDGLAPRLQAQIDHAGLGAQIRLSPALSDEPLRAEIGTRDVFVTASTYEGFGLTVIEAMAAGLVVVCRDMAPLNAFVADGQTGIFLRFDGGDADLTTIARIMDLSPADASGLFERGQAVSARYDWSAKGRDFLALYRSVMDQRPGPAGQPAATQA